MANPDGARSFARSGKSSWLIYVVAGVLASLLVVLLSTKTQASQAVLLRFAGNTTELESLRSELSKLQQEVLEVQDIALSGGSTEDKSLRADLEQLQQAVKKLQHGNRFPGAVQSSHSSIMMLNDQPLCHIERHGTDAQFESADHKQTAATKLEALARKHQQEQTLFCREFAAAEASPGGTPHNDTYTRLPAVRAVGNPDVTYPMWVHKQNDIVSNELIGRGVWEPAETANILARMEEWKQANPQESGGTVLLDVGANVGWFTLQAAAIGYRVLAVEPMPRNQGALRRTLCENPMLAEKVTLIPKGLSDKPRKCQLYVLKSNKGNGTPVCEGAAFANLKNNPEYELAGDFPLTTLDEAFNGTLEALAGRVQVVKIDVEGFEPQVYAGGRQFFGQVQPRYIMAELNQERNSAITPQTILHLYNDLGYGVHLHGFDGTLLLPKDYDHLAETQFAAPSINNIYMERLKPCS